MRNDVECWRDYIRRCILTSSFRVHPEAKLPDNFSREEALQDLLKLVFSYQYETNSISDDDGGLLVQKKDTILKALQKEVRKNRAYENCSLRIEKHWELGRRRESKEVKQSTGYDLICELEIKNKREAIGHVIGPEGCDTNKSTVKINGYKSRLGAFCGDTVGVKILGQIEDTVYGSVVRPIYRGHPDKFICQADLYNPINFLPLDKLVPIFVNLPQIANKMLRWGGLDTINESQKQYITIFDENSLVISEDNPIPKVKELIPLDLAADLLFVVKVIGWEKKYRKPLGAVVEAFPRTTNFYFTEKLLRLAHNVDDKDEPECSNIEVDIIRREDVLYDWAFTVDPLNAINLDDAISLVPTGDDTYKLAILITDVSKHINNALDQLAHTRGVSVYGFDKDGISNCIHMLPLQFSQQLSLCPGEVRDVIAVTARVTIRNGKVTIHSSEMPEKAQVVSQLKLSYETAQRVMQGGPIHDSTLETAIDAFNSKGSSTLKNVLYNLHAVAMALRVQRLQDAGYAYQVSDLGEEKCWQSHLVIEELMIWANKQLAFYMCSKLPGGGSLLRRQLAPLDEEKHKLAKILRKCGVEGTVMHSLLLSKLYPIDQASTSPLHVTADTLDLIRSYSASGDQVALLWALFTDSLYPQLSAVTKASMGLSRPAEYICNNSTTDKFHYSLNLSQYTHFTSPLRRHFDIAVQKLVTALLEENALPYSTQEMNKLCRHLNVKNRLAIKYKQAMEGVKFVGMCGTNVQRTKVYLVPSMEKENKFECCFPSNCSIPVKPGDARFGLPNLNCNGSCTWTVISASMKGPQYMLCNSHIGKLELAKKSARNEMKVQQISMKVFVSERSAGDQDSLSSCPKVMLYLTAPILSEVVHVPPDVWKLAHKFIKLPTEENKEKFISKLPHIAQNEPANIDSKHKEKLFHSPVVIYTIKKPIMAGDSANVWIGRSLIDPIPTPQVQLMEVAPTVHVCIAHNKHPAQCFSDVKLKTASKENYASVEEYIDLWSKTLLAEAAYNGIEQQTIVLIRDVSLLWGELVKPEVCIDDVYYVPSGSVCFEVPLSKAEIHSFIDCSVGDLVCARYLSADGSPNAVYHFVIDSVNGRDNITTQPVLVSMKAKGSHSCRVSPAMKSLLEQSQLFCDLQLIRMPDSFRYVCNCHVFIIILPFS